MADSFDPYYTWLGIPPAEQPPNYYRLLGISVFEPNAEVISHAADRQMLQLRTFQSGKHAQLSQKLLNEVSTARVCLLSPEKKQAYDARLHADVSADHASDDESTATNSAAAGEAEDFPTFRPARAAAARTRGPARSASRRKRLPVLLIVLAAIAALVAIVVALTRSPFTTLGDPAQTVDVTATPKETPKKKLLSKDTTPAAARNTPAVKDVGTNTTDASTSDTPRAGPGSDQPTPSPIMPARRPPVIGELPTQSVTAGKPFRLEITPADKGSEAAFLIYQLASAPPTGMRIEPRSGSIQWNVPADTAAGNYSIRIRVESTKSPDLNDESTMIIRVEAPPAPSEPPPETTKQPPPTADIQAGIESALHEKHKDVYSSSNPWAKLALAARLIQTANDATTPSNESFVFLQRARELAIDAGDPLLAIHAVGELRKRFHIDAVVLAVSTVTSAAKRVRSPSSIDGFTRAARQVATELTTADDYDTVLLSFRRVEKLATATKSVRLAANTRQTRLQLQAMRDLCRQMAVELEKSADADAPPAQLALGQFVCLAHDDWQTGLAHLAKADDDAYRNVAIRLQAQPDDSSAQLQMGDLWWDYAVKHRRDVGLRMLAQRAAHHWYQRALPTLAPQDAARVQQRLNGVFTATHQPLQLPLNGLAQLTALKPAKVSGKIAPFGQGMSLQGKSQLKYPTVPASSYVHELEVTFTQPQGVLSITYGGQHVGARLVFRWMDDLRKFRCRLLTYRAGVIYWGGEQTYAPQKKLQFTLYVNGNRQWLYQDGRRILSTGARPSDLTLQISADAKTAAVISRCNIRPWTEADARLTNLPMPPTQVDVDAQQADVKWHAEHMTLTDHPQVRDTKSFIVSTTGTAMQWIPPGSFQHTAIAANGRPADAGTTIVISHGFWIGRCEISQAEWTAVVPDASNVIRVTGSMLLPIDGVSYLDANRFCELLTRVEKRARRVPPGFAYRLPTEAEWEFACRAGSSAEYSVANGGFWAANTSGGRPHQVGQSKPNPWGLYDMHGNVDEWCLDAWQDPPSVPPLRLVDPVVAPRKTDVPFVLLGGAWWKRARACTASAREKSYSVAGGYRGLRIVLGPIIH